MKKPQIEDIVPPSEKRSIRDIELPSRRKKLPPIPTSPQSSTPRLPLREQAKERMASGNSFLKTPVQKPQYPTENISPDLPNPAIPSTDSIHSYSKRITRIASFGGFIVAIVLVYFLYLFLNVGALITVTQKTEDVGLKNSFSAKKNPQAGDLAFTVLTLEDTDKKSVPSTGEKVIERRASGKVVIFNKTSKSQRLVRNTRLETGDNLIFRIDNSVVVPAQKGTTPGSVEVVANADTAGEGYNIGLADFTIPGFKGDPRYSTIYGRSKTEMQGGMKGTIKTASAHDLEAGQADLKTSLKSKLVNKAKEQVPAGFLLYDGAVYTTYTLLSKPEDTEISMKASLHAILFKKDELAMFIAKNTLPDYKGAPLTSLNLQNLTFSPDSLETAPWNSGNLPFTLSGTTTLTWLYDSEKLKKDLSGVPQNKVNEIFKNYEGIKKAEVSIRPAWKSTLPEDSEKIDIINSDIIIR